MHENSIRAWWTFDRKVRQLEVCGALIRHGRPMTDRQVCTALGSQDMNYARPSITHMVQDGHLEEVASVRCHTTSHWVRVVWFAQAQPQPKPLTKPDARASRIPDSLFDAA